MVFVRLHENSEPDNQTLKKQAKEILDKYSKYSQIKLPLGRAEQKLALIELTNKLYKTYKKFYNGLIATNPDQRKKLIADAQQNFVNANTLEKIYLRKFSQLEESRIDKVKRLLESYLLVEYPSKEDSERRLQHIYALVVRGATEGERSAAANMYKKALESYAGAYSEAEAKKVDIKVKAAVDKMFNTGASSSNYKSNPNPESSAEKIKEQAKNTYFYLKTNGKKKGTYSQETDISKDAQYSYLYAIDILKGRFELGEKAIYNDAYYNRMYTAFLARQHRPSKESANSDHYSEKKYTNNYSQWEFKEILRFTDPNAGKRGSDKVWGYAVKDGKYMIFWGAYGNTVSMVYKPVSECVKVFRTKINKGYRAMHPRNTMDYDYLMKQSTGW